MVSFAVFVLGTAVIGGQICGKATVTNLLVRLREISGVLVYNTKCICLGKRPAGTVTDFFVSAVMWRPRHEPP